MHPTVKPVALVADAIKDCSRRGQLVLDPFAGSGTVLIATERTGRKARALELDPRYVDVAIKRWQKYTGKNATRVLVKDAMRGNAKAYAKFLRLAKRAGLLTNLEPPPRESGVWYYKDGIFKPNYEWPEPLWNN